MRNLMPVVVVVLLISLRPAVGQRADVLKSESDGHNVESTIASLCTVAEATDKADNDLALHCQSAPLQAVLRSESALWSFLIDPATSYEDRMAAAFQGSDLISAHEIPKLWKAYAELQQLPTGVSPSPCKFMWPDARYAGSPAEAWLARKTQPFPYIVTSKPQTRTVLGFKVDLPQTVIDYPLDMKGRNESPWLWQMERALAVLVHRVQQYYAQPDRYPQMAEAALEWQPENYFEKQIRVQNIASGPHNPVWIKTMVKLALQDGSGIADLYVYGADSFHLEELVHTAHIVILQQSQDRDVAAASAFQLGKMANLRVSQQFEFKPLRSSTSLLLIAKWAMNPELDDWTRYYLFASPICRILGEAPFVPNPRLDPKSPEVAAAMAKFEGWFGQERRRLAGC